MSVIPKVLAIVVNWNGAEVLQPAVASLLRSDWPGLRVMVVDNASDDGSVAELPGEIDVLRLDSNRGYAGGINAALRSILGDKGQNAEDDRPDYMVLMNNDLEVLPDTIRTLVEFAENKGRALCGPRILQKGDDTTMEAAWGEVSWSHVLARFHGKGAGAGDRWTRSQPVQLLLGSFLLVPRSVFEEIGLLDERFFMYHEEVDFLYRAHLKGIPSYFCNHATVFHRGGHSTARSPLKKYFWIRRNALLFLRKHRPGILAWGYYWATLAMSLLWNVLSFRWERVRTILQAVFEGYRMPADWEPED